MYESTKITKGINSGISALEPAALQNRASMPNSKINDGINSIHYLVFVIKPFFPYRSGRTDPAPFFDNRPAAKNSPGDKNRVEAVFIAQRLAAL
jgi:hypothetical protein